MASHGAAISALSLEVGKLECASQNKMPSVLDTMIRVLEHAADRWGTPELC